MSRVFFDYSTMTTFSGYPTGIPRTVIELAKTFKKSQSNIKLVALREDNKEFHDFDHEKKQFGDIALIRKGDWLFSASAGWAFSTFNEAVEKSLLRGVRYAQLYYDLIPYLFPHFFENPLFGSHYYKWIQQNLAFCSQAFFISNCTKKDIISTCLAREPSIPMNVIRLGESLPAAGFRGEEIPLKIRQLGRFALSVGTLEIRKNHIILLNAYRFLIENGFDLLPTLVLAGREGWLNNNLRYQVEQDPVLKGGVVIMTDVSDFVLDYLYRNCIFTLYPSLYEGWGLPIAESMNYGKPCIASNTSSMKEVAPEFTRFAHPLKLSEWVAHIQELSAKDKILDHETRRITSEYKPFLWKTTALQILKELK